MKKYLSYIFAGIILSSAFVSCTNRSFDFTQDINLQDSSLTFNTQIPFEKNLVIDINYGKIKLSQHDEDYVNFRVNKDYESIEIGASDGVIEIKEKNLVRIHDYNNRVIEILIPKSELDILEVVLDAGVLDVETILVKDVKVKTAVGNTNMKLENVNDFTFKGGVDSANIEINSINNMNIKSDVGSVDVAFNKISGEANITTNIGKVNLDIPDDLGVNISSKVTVGKVKTKSYINTDGSQKINIKTNIGDVEIK